VAAHIRRGDVGDARHFRYVSTHPNPNPDPNPTSNPNPNPNPNPDPDPDPTLTLTRYVSTHRWTVGLLSVAEAALREIEP